MWTSLGALIQPAVTLATTSWPAGLPSPYVTSQHEGSSRELEQSSEGVCVPSSSHGDAWASWSGAPTLAWTHVRDREHSKIEKQRDT